MPSLLLITGGYEFTWKRQWLRCRDVEKKKMTKLSSLAEAHPFTPEEITFLGDCIGEMMTSSSSPYILSLWAFKSELAIRKPPPSLNPPGKGSLQTPYLSSLVRISTRKTCWEVGDMLIKRATRVSQIARRETRMVEDNPPGRRTRFPSLSLMFFLLAMLSLLTLTFTFVDSSILRICCL